MTNPKDEDNPKTKQKGKSEWKKVQTVTKAVGSFSSKKHAPRPPGKLKRRETMPTIQLEGNKDNHTLKLQRRRSSTELPAEYNAAKKDVEPKETSSSATKVVQPKALSNKTSNKRKGTLAQGLLKEPVSEQIDPYAVYKNTVYELIKNTFSLAFGEDGELRITVDTVYPMLKTLGLNSRSESIMDLVRDASMESIGDIDPADFEKVIMSMVKVQDEDLWVKRLGEKENIRLKKSSEKAKDEAEKLRVQQEREKAGFEQDEVDDTNEWADAEKQKEEGEKEKKKEEETDELYNNLKMAFRFIDSDGDGVISTQDIYNLMMGLGEMMTDDELFGMVNMADLDCDGKVTFDDFRRFLATTEERAAIDKEGETADEEKGTKPEEQPTGEEGATNDASEDNATDETDSPNTIENTEVKVEVDTATKDVVKVPTDPNEEERLRRKKSMLWGYMSSASKLVTAMQPPVVEEKEDDTKPEPNIPEIKETLDTEKAPEITNDQDQDELNGQLDVIREEDEHSNYELEETDRVDSKMDNPFTIVADNKRKIISRQSSSASLKAQGLAGCDSIGDSGIETMNGSEIREQPDVFDLTDDEGDEELAKNKSEAMCDIYTTDNEDDEDMVDAHHVHESLSRVSSMESLDNIKDKLPSDDDDKESRVLSFVNQHMYIDIKQVTVDDDVINEQEPEIICGVDTAFDKHKMVRAQFLQKAILRRSATVPALAVTRRKLETPCTPKSSESGLVCSHIDIDLTCESPPKADIKSKIMFNERVKSAKRNRPRPESARSANTISVVDMSEGVRNKQNLSPSAQKSRWPFRPLTRPKSPGFRRVNSATSRKSTSDNDKDACELSIGVISETNSRCRPQTPFIRSRSANFARADLPKKVSPKRPETARSYSTSRTIETPVMQYVKQDNISLVVTEPFKNSEELYPRKSLLTTYHHGFKSIWPIGRGANLIRHKRPFSAFEMNSYSRSIERNEYPLNIEENVSKLRQHGANRTAPAMRGKALLKDTTVIKLELDSKLVLPPSRNQSSLSAQKGARRDVTASKVLCRFR